MAKKVSLRTESSDRELKDGQAVEFNEVRTTAGSITHPNYKSALGAKIFAPPVDTHCLTPQDANDGTENGKQDSFSMPAFANGKDVRHKG